MLISHVSFQLRYLCEPKIYRKEIIYAKYRKFLEKIFHKFRKFLENIGAKGNIEKRKNTHSEIGIGRLLVSSFGKNTHSEIGIGRRLLVSSFGKNTHSEIGIGGRLLVSSFDSRYCPMTMRTAIVQF